MIVLTVKLQHIDNKFRIIILSQDSKILAETNAATVANILPNIKEILSHAVNNKTIPIAALSTLRIDASSWIGSLLRNKDNNIAVLRLNYYDLREDEPPREYITEVKRRLHYDFQGGVRVYSYNIPYDISFSEYRRFRAVTNILKLAELKHALKQANTKEIVFINWDGREQEETRNLIIKLNELDTDFKISFANEYSEKQHVGLNKKLSSEELQLRAIVRKILDPMYPQVINGIINIFREFKEGFNVLHCESEHEYQWDERNYIPNLAIITRRVMLNVIHRLKKYGLDIPSRIENLKQQQKCKIHFIVSCTLMLHRSGCLTAENEKIM